MACGPDALHSIDPQGHMCLSEVRKKYGDRICTIGNVNCGLLQTGTDQEVVDDVHRCLKEGMELWLHLLHLQLCLHGHAPGAL